MRFNGRKTKRGQRSVDVDVFRTVCFETIVANRVRLLSRPPAPPSVHQPRQGVASDNGAGHYEMRTRLCAFDATYINYGET